MHNNNLLPLAVMAAPAIGDHVDEMSAPGLPSPQRDSDRSAAAPRTSLRAETTLGHLLQRRPDLMTPAEAGAYLGVAEATLATWRSTGRYELPYIRVGTRIYYTKAALDKFLADRTVTPA